MAPHSGVLKLVEMVEQLETNAVRSNPVGFGILAGVGAAVFYTGANIFLRETSTQVPPLMVTFTKAAFTWLCCAPVFFWGLRFYPRKLPSAKATKALIGAALFVQLAGSNGLQLGLALIGVALTIPLVMGTMVVSGVVLGRVFLREPIEALLALTILILAIALLSADAGKSHEHMQSEQMVLPATWTTAVGILAACLTGVTYSVLGVSIRRTLKDPVHPFTPIMFVTTTGILVLGPLAWLQLGWDGLSAFDAGQWRGMILGGVFNAAGFICLSYAFKHLNVIFVNAINVSQVALAAVAGITLFHEPATGFLIAGLIAMSGGFLLMGVTQYVKHRPV